MASLTVERYHDISCGHRVAGHESKCKHLHGHNYRVWFTCAADKLDSIGRVIDFGIIKKILCEWLEEEWDHKMLLWDQDELAPALIQLTPDSIVLLPFNPTAENMAEYLLEHIGPVFLAGTNVRLTRVRIDETRKCSAVAEDQ